MMQFLSNAFNDPSDPWYYVIGVLFLLLVFGALAVYILWNGKRKKQDAEQDKQDVDKTEAPDKDKVTESTDAATEQQQDKE